MRGTECIMTAERLAVCRHAVRRWCLFVACLRWAGAQTDFTPLPSASSCHGQNLCRGMHVYVCVSMYALRAVPVCHPIVPTSTIPSSSVKGIHCTSSMLRRTNISLFVLRLKDLMNAWRYQIICQCLCLCVRSLMDLRVNYSDPQ